MFEQEGFFAQGRPYMQFVTAGLPSRYGSWGLLGEWLRTSVALGTAA